MILASVKFADSIDEVVEFLQSAGATCWAHARSCRDGALMSKWDAVLAPIRKSSPLRIWRRPVKRNRARCVPGGKTRAWMAGR